MVRHRRHRRGARPARRRSSQTAARQAQADIHAPNVDGGDFVIVINAEKIAVSGDKLNNKYAYRHSGYPGGLRRRTIGQLLIKHPTRVVENAIVGMLPHTKLSRQAQKKLKVYAGPNHPHAAQQPIPFEIKQVAQ